MNRMCVGVCIRALQEIDLPKIVHTILCHRVIECVFFLKYFYILIDDSLALYFI